MRTSWKQALVKAHREVNRAFFFMNAEVSKKRHPYSCMKPEQYSEPKILITILSAIADLKEARDLLEEKIEKIEKMEKREKAQ